MLEVDRGTHVVLNVVNEGDQPHDLAVDGGAQTRLLDPGESQRLDLGRVAGDSAALCTLPGHSTAGMTLEIQAIDPLDGARRSDSGFAHGGWWVSYWDEQVVRRARSVHRFARHALSSAISMRGELSVQDIAQVAARTPPSPALLTHRGLAAATPHGIRGGLRRQRSVHESRQVCARLDVHLTATGATDRLVLTTEDDGVGGESGVPMIWVDALSPRPV